MKVLIPLGLVLFGVIDPAQLHRFLVAAQKLHGASRIRACSLDTGARRQVVGGSGILDPGVVKHLSAQGVEQGIIPLDIPEIKPSAHGVAAAHSRLLQRLLYPSNALGKILRKSTRTSIFPSCTRSKINSPVLIHTVFDAAFSRQIADLFPAQDVQHQTGQTFSTDRRSLQIGKGVIAVFLGQISLPTTLHPFAAVQAAECLFPDDAPILRF